MPDLKQMRVLVSATSYGKSDPGLIRDLESQVGQVIYNQTGKPLKSADLAKMVEGVDGFIAGVDVIDRAALEHADRLKVIARYGVGVDNVDLAYARERGIVVTNTPGANSVSVAEMSIALMLDLARPIPDAIAATRQGNWPRSNGWTLEGKTVGLLGFGAIGRAAAVRLRAFDCRVLAYDPYPDRAFADKVGVELAGMDAILPECDFVSLHLPLLPETRGLVNAGFLAKMKAGSYLVNTARGELVNDADLADAIRSRHLAGAGLDVFAVEPPPADNPLLSLPQVIVTPHMSAHTDGATNRMGWMALENCLAVLRGGKPTHPVA
ncbi:phosphoglycerate dehydrogenase [Longilinea arvoryzae]|uniref:Phosphoglycerate dehydrogenase n=1 Tax=Longilinea arvoryzae TaxID=360412 RepID=A0A0S7B774_9CHLR|nr:phosphoglycerate dehydrogenase [Longilinea arvoryzae]GAP13151.1 phosphoglycerate dehydrogenase [Longilinea arvoryzae]